MSYSLMMEGRSIEDLHDYINNYQKYWPDAIEAAVAELKRRGEVFTLEEQADIEKRIAERRLAVKDFEMQQPVEPLKYDEPLQVSVPKLYSPQAIFGFTVFFSIVLGAILLCINLKRLGKIREMNTVILGSFAYFFGGSLLLAGMAGNVIVSLLFNIGGALLLNLFFWKKYIGDIPYERKQVWLPLLICLVIFIPIALWMQSSGMYPIAR